MGDKYSAIIVLDADNIVSPNFLTEMNVKLNNGHKVIQGYIDSKNPNDNWLTMSYSIAFWSNNRLFQLCRDNLGLSCQLSGTARTWPSCSSRTGERRERATATRAGRGRAGAPPRPR